MTPIPASRVTGITWPAIVDARAAQYLAAIYQLENTQWLPPEALRRQQFRQLNELLHHAFATTDFYRQRLGNLGFTPQTAVTADFFQTIPLLQREEIQTRLTEMNSRGIPREHGRMGLAESSGSTGKPLTIYSTSVSNYFWEAFSLRDHFWHGRDFSRRHAVIRVGVKNRTSDRWSKAVNSIFASGSNSSLDIREDVDAQIRWMRKTDPAYLLTYPSNLREMARRCLKSGIGFPGLRELRTFGETVTPEDRDLCRQAWGVEIKDTYSAMEIGYLALQCPAHEHYHVMSEGVFLEILDDQGRPCAPGQVGRVVVTDLHNFATPLIRYKILDYAEAGDNCDCGRGLPVLKRIMGRRRNMMKLPDGRTIWPAFSPRNWPGAGRIRQLQIVQKAIDRLVVRLVMPDAKLGAAEEEAIAGIIRERTDCPLHVEFAYPAAIEKPPNFKFDMFISEI